MYTTRRRLTHIVRECRAALPFLVEVVCFFLSQGSENGLFTTKVRLTMGTCTPYGEQKTKTETLIFPVYRAAFTVVFLRFFFFDTTSSTKGCVHLLDFSVRKKVGCTQWAVECLPEHPPDWAIWGMDNRNDELTSGIGYLSFPATSPVGRTSQIGRLFLKNFHNHCLLHVLHHSMYPPCPETISKIAPQLGRRL